MITREQVVDLQPGDVVEVRQSRYPEVVTTGPVREIDGEPGALALGVSTLRYADGLPPSNANLRLTVVSRAPRPLYVNHPRTEPVPGDVVRVEFCTGYEDDWCMNAYAPDADGDMPPWLSIAREEAGCRYTADMVISTPGGNGVMRLLVDGETGQTVPERQA